MVRGPEVVASRDPAEYPVQFGLELVAHREVGDRAARLADEVVMVVGQALGELVARPLVGAGDATNRIDPFEHDEVPVHRALGQFGDELTQLGHRARPGRPDQRGDEGAATGRVALPVAAEAVRDRRVDVARHPASVPANENQ